MWNRSQRISEQFDQVAGITSRLALFISAGLSPPAAWRELAEESSEGASAELIEQIATALAQGSRHRDAVFDATIDESVAWRECGAVIALADLSGAPLAGTLWSLSESMAERSRVEREIRAIATAPKMTMWLLLGLVPLGLLVASMLGAQPVEVLMGSSFGQLTAFAGVVMLVLAWRWMARLIGHAIPDDDHSVIERELFAIAVSAGGLPEAAQQRVHAVMEQFQLTPASSQPLVALATLSRRAGVPVAQLARAEAAWSRDRRRTDAQERAQALSVRILIPVGLLILPAFVALAIVPVVVSLLGQALSSTPVPW